MRITKAVILGAGKGSRMKSELPKVLHCVGGRPMILHSIDRARAAGIGEVVIVVGYGKEQVMQARQARGSRSRSRTISAGPATR